MVYYLFGWVNPWDINHHLREPSDRVRQKTVHFGFRLGKPELSSENHRFRNEPWVFTIKFSGLPLNIIGFQWIVKQGKIS